MVKRSDGERLLKTYWTIICSYHRKISIFGHYNDAPYIEAFKRWLGLKCWVYDACPQ